MPSRSIRSRAFAGLVAVVVAGAAGRGSARAQTPGTAAEELALAREVMDVVQVQLREQGEAFSRTSRPGAPDGRHRFAEVYGGIMTRAIADQIDQGPRQPLEFAIAALAFLPLYTEVNKTIAETLPDLEPGQPLTRRDRRALRRAGVPRHWVSYMRLVQDPRAGNATAQTVAGIVAHILGDLKEVVRADLSHIAGNSTSLRRYLSEALPGERYSSLRRRVFDSVSSGSRYRDGAALRGDYDAINPMIARETEATFEAIAKGAAEQGRPDFVAELAWRVSHGVEPVRFRSLVQRISRLVFRTWRDRAFDDGARLSRLERKDTRVSRARARLKRARSNAGAVARIKLLRAAARASESKLLRAPLGAAARGLKNWRERSTQRKAPRPRR